MEELRGVLRCNRRKSIKDYWQGKVPDLKLRWTAIRGAINVVNYTPPGLWLVRVWESEKVLMETSEVFGEVQRYWEVLYAKRLVTLPAFERLVRPTSLGVYLTSRSPYATTPCWTSRTP